MIRIEPKKRISGEIKVNGDKSISHRALIFSAMSKGYSEIENLSSAGDCYSTVKCLVKLGVEIEMGKTIRILGKGLGGFKEPEDILDVENSGTTIRLISGLLAGQPFFSVITGDSSLRRRPVDRVIVPLSLMGAEFWSRGNNKFPPVAVKGRYPLKPINYELPVASAQVKSAIIIAGLFTDGKSSITEPLPSRDHTERLLPAFGAKIEKNGNTVTVYGGQGLEGQKIYIPGDFSSASFFMVAGLIVPESEILIKDVGLNPGRIGLLGVIERMGGDIEVYHKKDMLNEPVGDILVRSSSLRGTVVKRDEIPILIDEVPLIAVLGAFAEGETVVNGAEELRVKESDRIKAIVTEFKKLKVDIEEMPDGFIIRGPSVPEGGRVESYNDHRIAMALAIAGLASKGPVEINNEGCVVISFPDFWDILNGL
ncbi:MAG TPA: 3-phosphoshikimate 1-carboxyvinyltransferase [bacterium]|nr:3-phosphoshikimate 1-carboxyvinyltransferase [bacterium]